MIDRSTGGEPHMDFVFSDKGALQRVRFRHFVRDCRNLLHGGSGDLDRLIEREKQAMIAFLRTNHRDILGNSIRRS
jgi:hypothetical protein